jgi:mevalonate kinase
LTTYVAIAKTNTQREIDATTIIIASFNNINQRRQLKKTKRKKTMIFKIKKQREKNNLRTLFVRKLMKRLQRVEKIKKNMMIARRLLSENVELMTRFEKIRNRLTINNSLLKHVTSST